MILKNCLKIFFDIVVNCATVLPGGDYLDNDYLKKIFSTNILGTQNICKWIAAQKSVKKIINCSTLVVVNKPWPDNLTEEEITYPTGDHVLYSGSKLFQELIVETFAVKHKINFVNVRFSAIYGDAMPQSGVVWNLCQQAKMTNKIIIKNGNKVSFDFIHVTDAAKSIISLFGSDSNSGILNVASGVETSLIGLATIIKNSIGLDIEIINEDNIDFINNFSKINVSKLNEIVDVEGFVNIETGIDKVIKSW